MKSVDLNLLIALDVLLEEGSVTGAAERMRTSTPTMSRTLARLRRAFGDPLLVRAGRRMVPTPRALALRDQVRSLVEQATGMFLETGAPDLASLTTTFTVQANDMVIGALAQPLLSTVHRQAPNVTVRFVPEDSGDSAAKLREGVLDLVVGVADATSPEVNSERLIVDRVRAVVRGGHPLLRGEVTRERFAAAQHLSVSRRGRLAGPIDDHLAEHGLHRKVVSAVPSWAASWHMVVQSDLVGLAAEKLSRQAVSLFDLRTVRIPLPLPPIVIAQSWHARHQADPTHAWFRLCVRSVFESWDADDQTTRAYDPGAPA
ncbi:MULTISPECIES: LysR family transcriptional regulator [unclassified Streptomyces]|uniref:LysR family transcriptional regulator n=1 Tax=unclassified Streptomyces TaxID=2593676 RepID=UPI00037450CE|nr:MULTISPECIES: LysR family transcriptional regulator [unclassified Streptomyces]MYT30088.1 LysR family transcriptional regulator [Streptomyces sp. SID8354]